MTNIVILTGAGISAESGLGTFRDEGGLWAEHPVEDVATPEGFERDPQLVIDFYNARRIQAAEALANDAHAALARLENEFSGNVLIVTQNVDGLHEQAGSRNVLHMHGQLDQAKCSSCRKRWLAAMEMAVDDPCPFCRKPTTRPDIVWFGEIPYGLRGIERALSEADLFVSIGTSGNVYPAAGFVELAKNVGAKTLELNLEPTQGDGLFDEVRSGPASQVVPEWVEQMLMREAKAS